MKNRLLAPLAMLLALVAPAVALEIKSDTRPGPVPPPMAPGETGINLVDGRFFYRDEAGNRVGGLLPDLDASGYLKFRNGMVLGRNVGGKLVPQPERIEIQGTGSNGDASQFSVKPEADGGQAYGLAERMRDEVNVMAFIPPSLRNAIRDHSAATDLTPYLRKAFATGKRVRFPAGRYPVCDSVPLASGQEAVGDGVVSAYLWVGSCFNMNASAVIAVATGDSSGWDGLGIRFDQSGATNRATLRRYPWAMDISSASRFKMGRIRIGAAWNGIKCVGNCGGFDGGLLEIGAFNTGAVFDGPLDFVHINSGHSWPWDIAGRAELMAAYTDGRTVGFEFGRVDGLDIKSLNTFSNKIIGSANGNDGAARQIALMQLDGDNSTFENAAGDWQIGLLSTTKSGAKNVPAVTSAAGNVNVASIRLWGANNGSYLRVTGGIFAINGGTLEQRADRPAAEVSGGRLVLTSALLQPLVGSEGPARTQAFIKQSGAGVLVATGNTATLKANGGGGALFEIGTDAPGNVVTENVMSNWGLSLPAIATSGTYGDNAVPANPYVSGIAVGREYVKRFTGTFDASGNAVFPHGLPASGSAQPVDRIVGVAAFGTNTNGFRRAYPQTRDLGWENTNIALAGGGASFAGLPFVATVRYR